MAYEASEIMTAAALMYSQADLKKVKTEGDLQSLMTSAKKKISDKTVQFGNTAMKTGFISLMNPLDGSKLQDLAGGISAALGIRKYMNIGDRPVVTYMTGNA